MSIIDVYYNNIQNIQASVPPAAENPPVCRSASPTAMAAAIATLSERRPGRIGMTQPGVGGLMHRLRHPHGFAAEQQDVAGPIGVIEVGHGRSGGEQDEAQAMLPPPGLENAPGDVAVERDLVEIVHAGAAEGAVGGGKPGRLDDMGLDAKAGRQPQNRAGVLRNVGLVEGDPHGAFRARSGRRQSAKPAIREGVVRLIGQCGDSGLALVRQGCQ